MEASPSKAYAQISTQIEGIDVGMTYLNNKVYFNAADKFMFVADTTSIANEIKQFLTDIGVDLSADNTSKIIEVIESILDVNTTPLLITALNETENGFSITTYNDITLTIANDARKITIASGYDVVDFEGTIYCSDEEIELPTIDETLYTQTEPLFSLLAAVYNSGILDLINPALNTFKTGKFGFDFKFDYAGNNINGNISINAVDLAAGVNVNVRGVNINIIMLDDNVAYVEFGNVFVKFALDDLTDVGTLLNKHFGIDLPFDTILEVVDKLRQGSFTASDMLETFDIDFDITKIDLEIFNSIIREDETFSIPLENIGTFTVAADEEKIKSIGFAGFDMTISATINDFVSYALSHDKSQYIDLADFIPTIDNGLDLINYNTFNGTITIDDGNLNVPINYVIALNGEDYAEFSTAIYGANIKAVYYKTKVYLEFAESVKVVVDINKMPAIIKELMDSAGKNLPDGGLFNAIDNAIQAFVNKDTSNIVNLALDLFDNVKSIFNAQDNAMLLKGLNQTENGFILTLYDDTKITLTNSKARIDVDTKISNTALNFYIEGKNGQEIIPNIDETLYTPMENVLELVKAFFNMTHKDDFNIQGTINVKLELLGMDGIINMNIPLNAQVKIVDGKTEFQAVVGEIPAIVGVNNDVPYKVGDTESGSGRMLYIYYSEGDIYLYRHEYVDILFGIDKREYEKCTKIAAATFIENPMYYLQYGIGFSDTIMNAINDAMTLAQNREGDINLNNVVNSFAANGDNFNIVLNLHEIANNPQLGDLNLNLGLGYDSEDKSYIHTLGLNVNMPFADGVEMDVSSNDLAIVDYGSTVDLSRLKEYVTNYKYAYNQEWEASNGEWEKSSETIYTIYFEENGGAEVSDISVVYKDPITLPTLPTRVIDDGNKQETLTFAGWYTSNDFKDKTLFTSTTMPRKDTTLYAKWDSSIRYYYTMNFVSEHNVSFNSIKALEGATISVPTYSGSIVEDDGTAEYTFTFAGWYSSPSFEEETRFKSAYMPSENTTLYAKWDCSTIFYRTLSFNTTGSGKNVESITALAGTQIQLPSIDTTWIVDDGITKNTKTFDSWWTTENYVSGTKFIAQNMPDADTVLYAKWNDHVEYYRTISFVTDDYNTSINSITKLAGTSVEIPALVSKTEIIDGLNYVYNFGGWYTESELENEFTSSVMPQNDVTLYAKWILAESPKTLTVYHNGTEIYQTQISEGMSFSLNNIASLPSDTLYYLDPDFKEQYTAFVMEEDLVLYARVKYTLTVTNHLGATQTYTDYQGAKIGYVTPSTPATYDDGIVQIIYSFGGYSESIESMPNENKTISVIWNEAKTNYSTITYVSNYSAVSFASVTKLEGNSITLPTSDVVWLVKDDGRTERITRTFAGWYTDSALTNKFTSSVMPAQNTTLYGYWKETVQKYYKITFSKDTNASGGYEDNIVFSSNTTDAYFLEGTEVDLTQFTATWEYQPFGWWHHDFFGWSYSVPDSIDRDTIKGYAIDGQKITITDNVTLYAAWSYAAKAGRA